MRIFERSKRCKRFKIYRKELTSLITHEQWLGIRNSAESHPYSTLLGRILAGLQFPYKLPLGLGFSTNIRHIWGFTTSAVRLHPRKRSKNKMVQETQERQKTKKQNIPKKTVRLNG